MRIATWNINGIRARLDFVVHWLRARQPDQVGLQELKVDQEGFPFEVFEKEGYQALAHGQKAWNGVAILSRQPLREEQLGLPGHEAEGARLVSAQAGSLSFMTIYVPNGKAAHHPDFEQKLDWLDGLQRLVEDHYDPARPLVVCGDFNICPAPLDSWNEELLHGTIFHTDQERRRFQTLAGWGLRDVFREQRPDQQAFSWWDYRAGAFHKNQGLRIDFLLATRPVATRVRNVEIDREYRKKKDGLIASDHAPVWADL